jgi:hypothetical protein
MSNDKKEKVGEGSVPQKSTKRPEDIGKGFVPPQSPKKPPEEPKKEKN